MGNNNSFYKGVLTGALVTCLGVALFGVTTGTINLMNFGNSKVVSSEVMNKIQLIDSAIDMYYLYDVDEENLVDMIYAGYVVGLGDEYSAYYNEEATVSLLESTSGEYTGIGAMLSQHISTGVITVTIVYENTPAEEVEIQEGDVLTSVDGESVDGEELTEVVNRIKGEAGTQVELKFVRAADGEEYTVTPTRQVVETNTVAYEMLEDNIGYVKIDQFDKVTTSQFEQALDELKEQGMEEIIFDIRNNPGGSLSVVCEMLDMVIEEGLLVYTEDKNGNRTEKNASTDAYLDIPMVVLVNEYSASASEIFSGAIQDYELGEIIGTTTYGKGVVQQLIDLKDGTTLKLTISEYFTPLGRSIHEIGIVPDIVVEQDLEDTSKDLQLEAAIKYFQ